MRRLPGAEWLLLGAAAAVFAVMLLARLGHPLLWQDEAETAMFAQRVAEYGYPKVHGERNVVYEFGTNIALGIDERSDAYIGTTWGQIYLAVPGLWWARAGASDYARTARLRLPFALLGAAGVLVFLLAVLPVFRGRPRRARSFAGLYLLLAALSISLILHLREVRYYGPLLLCTAALFRVHLRWRVFRSLGDRAYVAWVSVLLFLVFQLFYAAWFAFGALLAAEAVATAAWDPGARGGRVRRALPGILPVVLSGVAAAPFLVFFETFAVAARFGESQGAGLGGYASNLGWLAGHLLRHEMLGPVVAVRALRLLVSGRADRAGWGVSGAVSNRLLAFAGGYALITCVNPVVYERYFVLLSPVLTLAFLLDAFSLAEAAGGAGRRWRGGVGAALAALGLGVVALHAPEVRGRLEEIAVPVRGPVDFVVDYVRSHYADPAGLVIATNYEANPLMYYLGSHVIVGLSRNNIIRERSLSPDLLIPRRRWRSSLPEVLRFRTARPYDEIRLPIRDLYYNNTPSLSPSRTTPEPHRFRTARTDDPAEELVIYARRPAPSPAEVIP